MQKRLMVSVVFVFVIALALACTALPAGDPSARQNPPRNSSDNPSLNRPASAPGGSAPLAPTQTTFVSPLPTPIGATATPFDLGSAVEMTVAFAGPAIAGQPVTLDITIKARRQTADLLGGVVMANVGGETLQVVTTTLPSLAANEQHYWSPTLQLPASAGLYQLGAVFSDIKLGATYDESFYFAVTGGTVVTDPPMPSQDAPPTIEYIGTPRAT
jgi:hypothetical protein